MSQEHETVKRRFSDEELSTKVFEALRDILAAELEEISDTTSLREELHATSLDLVQLLWALEDEIGESIPDESIEQLDTPAEIVEFLSEFQRVQLSESGTLPNSK